MQVAELKAATTGLEQQAWSAAQRAKRAQQQLMAQLDCMKSEVAALTEDRYELQVTRSITGCQPMLGTFYASFHLVLSCRYVLVVIHILYFDIATCTDTVRDTILGTNHVQMSPCIRMYLSLSGDMYWVGMNIYSTGGGGFMYTGLMCMCVYKQVCLGTPANVWQSTCALPC